MAKHTHKWNRRGEYGKGILRTVEAACECEVMAEIFPNLADTSILEARYITILSREHGIRKERSGKAGKARQTLYKEA